MRSRALVCMFLGVCMLGIPLIINLPSKLICNASNSVPRGLYGVVNEVPSHGKTVVVRLPFHVRKQAHELGILPVNIPLLKPIAALQNDEICRFGHVIFINKEAVSVALKYDQKGRKLPQWQGCFVLQSDEFFLLSDHKTSFDSRYFGTINRQNIEGVAKQLWVWK